MTKIKTFLAQLNNTSGMTGLQTPLAIYRPMTNTEVENTYLQFFSSVALYISTFHHYSDYVH